MQLTSHNEIIDRDTGVIISESSKSIKIPDRIFINASFTKVFDNTRFDLNHIELGYLMMLNLVNQSSEDLIYFRLNTLKLNYQS